MEVAAIELYQGQPLKNDVELFMHDHGFVCMKDTVNETAGDQLYVNRELTTRSDLLRGYIARRRWSFKRRLIAFSSVSRRRSETVLGRGTPTASAGILR